METFLEEKDDLNWLNEVHQIPIEGIACAIVYGNEDSPQRVETFTENDYRCKPEIYEFNPETDKLELRENETAIQSQLDLIGHLINAQIEVNRAVHLANYQFKPEPEFDRAAIDDHVENAIEALKKARQQQELF